MEVYALIFLIVHLSFGNARKNYDLRPRISVKNGHLQIMAPTDKNITFITTGRASGVSINHIDVLTTLNKAHNATKLTESYQRVLSTYSDRLEALEQRPIEPIMVNSLTNSTQVDTSLSLRRLNRRVRFFNQRLLRMESLLNKDECSSNPCQNGATCQDMFNNFLCRCPDGWEGENCNEDVNECARFAGTDLGCQNGATCINKPGTYECNCVGGFIGLHCTKRKGDCFSGGTELCGHGTCVSQNNALGYKCICDQGWTTDGTNQACIVDVNECKLNHPPCSISPHVECINVPGSFYCAPCPSGFVGNGYHCSDVDECATNNGGCSMNPMVLCINTHGSRICGLCPPGYSGDGVTCSYQGVCNVNNGGCHNLATCRSNPSISSSYVECICPSGYVGNGIGPNGCTRSFDPLHPCSSNPCKTGECTTNKSTGDYICTCKMGYTGRNCDIIRQDPCNPNPCLNDGECQNTDNSPTCKCKTGFVGRFCQIQRQACGGYLRGENGTIKYPSDDFEDYGHRANCAWTINSGNSSKVLNITIKHFDIEDTPNCQLDWLEIHDGPNTAAQSMGRFCGKTLPLGGNFSTTHNSVYLWFRSHNGISGKGFELTWNVMNPKCGGTISKSSHGSIQSPGAPEKYPLNRDCYWNLLAPFEKRYMFHFFSLDIGENPDCNHDYLKFYSMLDGREESVFEKFCNSSKPGPFYSPGSRVRIHFHSDAENTHQGFQITYSVVEGTPGCGGVYTARQGTIQSIPGTSEFDLVICQYKIQQSINTKIKITFLNFNLGVDDECSYNFVEIHEGPDEQSPSIGKYCGTNMPTQYISSGNQVTIVSSTLNRVNGWKIKYEKVCGATYVESSGSFSIANRTDDSECVYLIERPPGYKIIVILKVSIPSFFRMTHSGRSNRCFPGYFEVRDGDHENATLIGQYCGNKTINITSSHNTLWMKMSRLLIPARSQVPLVTAEYTSVDVGCGGILRNKFGSISPPVADGSYVPSSTCTWVIIAPAQNVIQLTWMTFNIEESYDCSYDNVQVFDNNTDLGMGGLVGKYCGFKLPPIVLSSSNIMTVLFTSDVSINMDGFLASYIFIPEKNVCGGSYFTSAGVLKSPRYPEDYPTNRECTWTIHVLPGQQIMLNVTEFDIESYSGCRYDWLEIRNGGTSASPLIGKFCGTQIPKLIPSHANKLYLFFKSDLSRSGKGFRITWSSAATGCGGVLTSPTGSIISPHYPEPYSRNTECIWKIITSTGSRIQVIFADIDLEKHVQCVADYVQLFDGSTTNSNSLGKFCNEIIEPIKSTSNKMLVKFRSDVAFQGRGFQLQYTTVCHNTVKGYRGVIESPNFPNDYPQDEDCLWEIVVSSRNKINITFSHFELERSLTFANNSCMFDYVEISYAEPPADYYSDEKPTYTKYGKYCGHQNPGHLSIDSDHVQIHFVSDKLLLGSGFRLEWEMVGCGGHIKENKGTISSPNYPKPYPATVVCEWLIEVDFGSSVQIEFNEINIEKDNMCSFDSIKIYNGLDDTYNLLARFCRQRKKTVVSSTGNFMFVKFEADYSYQGTGFIANFTSVPTKCGGKFSASEGSIFSPNYPKNYNKNETCEYSIEVEDGHSIELHFEDVDLFSSDNNCSRNYVKVHDGPSLAYPVLATVCGDATPNTTFRSTYNHMFVEFMSHSFFTTKGFLAKYNRACGSTITTNDRGVININEDEFRYKSENCTWTIISLEPNKHVSLTISSMHGQPYCDWQDNNVNIYNGDSVDSPLLKSLCGSKIPPTMVSDGSALTISINTPITFFATYSIYDSQCGGTLLSSEGFFSTPGYPKEYASGIKCEWTIQISPGNKVTLNFIEFELLDSDGCNSDFLEIRSINSSGSVLGTFCGDDTPENITHTGSLWLLYKSSKLEAGDPPISAKGFYGEYQLDDYNELTGPSGEIYSPLYPRSYLEYKIFSWKITVDSNKRVLLSFKEFNLDADDDDQDCYFAVLEVFDGVDDTGTSLGRHCGQYPPKPIKSSSNILFIKVDYNSPRMGSRYILKWEEVEGVNRYASHLLGPPNYNTSCGGAETIDVNSLHNYTFHSPGFPGGYEPNLKCEWLFSTIPMNHLTIQFLVLDFGTNLYRFQGDNCNTLSDSVKLFQKHSYDNDWQMIKTVCKHETTVFSATDLMKVLFETSRFINGSGFSARVEEACGGYLSEPTGHIIFNSSTPQSSNCEWNITVRSTKTIELFFEEMNIRYERNKGCDNYIMVRNGKFPDSPILGNGKYCGTELPEKLKSSGNNLYVKYRGSSELSSFRLKYQEVSSSCGGEIILSPYDNHTEISSPNYPNIPTPHIECQWLIRSPPGELLRIDFQERFDLMRSKNCEKEYVEIRDGGTEFSRLIGRFCNSLPSSQFSTDNVMFIKFFTDIDDPKNGFRAKVSISRCGGTIIQGRNGVLSYSNPANTEKADCKWHLIGLTDHYLKVSFTQMEIKSSVNCTNNFISLYEQNEISNVTLLGKFCGKTIPASLTTSSNDLFVHYVGDNTGRFILHSRSIQTGCGGILNQESGEITSPGYPVMNHFRRMCKWTIKVPEGRSITLTILDWDVSEAPNEQLLYAYDGKFSEATSFDIKKDRVIQSSSNKMHIIFYSNSPSAHRGFKAKFDSNSPTICRGDFSLASGVFHTPIIRNYSYNCEWTHKTNNLFLNQTTALAITLVTNYNSSTCFPSVCDFASASVIVTNEEKKNDILNCLCGNTVRPVIVRSPFLITKLEASVSPKYHMNFSVSYNTHQCGGIIHGQSGRISSPNFPNQPSNTIECAWLLKVNEGQTINITISTLNLGDDCERSFLEIFNGDLPTHPRIGKYCKNNKPDSVISQSEKVWIEYRWEKGSSGKGFQLQYEAISSGCGGTFHDRSRIIQSPNYESDYGNNAECVWIIQSSPGYHLKLEFIGRFHIEDSKNCTNDYLEIFDWVNEEWVSLGRKCGRNNPVGLSSSSDKMKLLFRTNARITASGFKARWDWICGGKFLATKVPRILTSAGYPVFYEGNIKCEYVIETKSGVLSLRFLDFKLEQGGSDCKNDNITIQGRSYATYSLVSSNVYCGDQIPPTHRMRDSAIITFRTDKYLFQRGFKLEYKDESCGGEITEETVIGVGPTMQSIGWPRYSQPRIDCGWNITAPPNQIVVLTINKLRMFLSPMCFGQSLQVFDNLQENRNSRLAQLCGNINDEYPILSQSNKMRVKFSAIPGTRSEFNAAIRFSHGPKEGCGGILNLTDTMYIQSPNLPDLDCGWKIVAPRDYQIQIVITELNLPKTCDGNNNTYVPCDCSRIEIRDGGGPFSDKIEQLCSNTSSFHTYANISSSRNAAYIRLLLRGKKQNAFKATLRPIMSLCGPSNLNVTSDIQTLTSPSFPASYPPNLKCTYTFSVPQIFEKISLHFIIFDLVDEVKPAEHKQLTKCVGDTIQIFEDPNNQVIQEGLGPGSIYNGGSNSMSMIYSDANGRQVFCGKDEIPFDYYSSGKTIVLTFTSSNSIFKGSGFKLEYSIAGCSRNYTSLQGRIYNGDAKLDCLSSIIVPENRTISLYFNTFYMFQTVNCSSQSLVVRDGSPTGTILLNACGYRLPDPVFSFTNKLFIHSHGTPAIRFMMKYDIVYTSTENGRGCGGELYNNKGKIFSPMYPNAFRNDTTCTWIIKVPVGLHAALKFTSFDIQGICEQTSVRVKTYTSDYKVNTVELCRDYQIGAVIRSESSIEIIYRSSIHNGGSGWVAQFRAVGNVCYILIAIMNQRSGA